MEYKEESRDNLSVEQQGKQEESYGQILKYTGLLGGVQGLTMLVNILRNKLATVFLGPLGMGLVSILYSLINFFYNFTNLGLPMSVIRQVADQSEGDCSARRDRMVQVVRVWSLIAAVGGTLVFLLLAPWAHDYTFQGKDDYLLEVMCLTPVVGFMTISGVELALMKAVRSLRKVALSSLIGGVTTLLTTIPFYYFMGMSGIVLALLVSTFSVMCVTLYYSRRVFPWRLNLGLKEGMREGGSLVRMGLAFIFSGVLASASDWIIPVYIKEMASLEYVSFFKMGYSMMITYPGMVFIAMEADYFPRLTMIHNNRNEMNESINRQAATYVLLMAPLLVAFMVFMPFLVRLLYTPEFLPIVDMAVCATLYMLFKSVSLPLAYLPMAKNDIYMYLLMDFLFYVFLTVAVVLGFRYWGLIGSGVALSVASFVDLVVLLLVYGYRYQVRLKPFNYLMLLVQTVVLTGAILCCLMLEGAAKYLVGLALLVVSGAYSFSFLRKNTGVSARITEKWNRLLEKFGRWRNKK